QFLRITGRYGRECQATILHRNVLNGTLRSAFPSSMKSSISLRWFFAFGRLEEVRHRTLGDRQRPREAIRRFRPFDHFRLLHEFSIARSLLASSAIALSGNSCSS